METSPIQYCLLTDVVVEIVENILPLFVSWIFIHPEKSLQMTLYLHLEIHKQSHNNDSSN